MLSASLCSPYISVCAPQWTPSKQISILAGAMLTHYNGLKHLITITTPYKTKQKKRSQPSPPPLLAPANIVKFYLCWSNNAIDCSATSKNKTLLSSKVNISLVDDQRKIYIHIMGPCCGCCHAWIKNINIYKYITIRPTPTLPMNSLIAIILHNLCRQQS